jgi:hypothetical protein
MNIFLVIKDEKSIANRMNILFKNWNYFIKKRFFILIKTLKINDKKNDTKSH